MQQSVTPYCSFKEILQCFDLRITYPPIFKIWTGQAQTGNSRQAMPSLKFWTFHQHKNYIPYFRV